MNYILLLLVTVGVSIQNILKKGFNLKYSKSRFAFPALSVVAAAAGSIIYALIEGNFNFNKEVLPFALFFALVYLLAGIFSMFSVATGPLSLTSLVISYSLLIPTFYGIVALDEKITKIKLVGFLMLAISLLLMNYKGKAKEKTGISLKWVIFVTIAFICNGLCSTVQKVQQIQQPGLYKGEFLVISFVTSAAVLSLIAFFTERETLKVSFKGGMVFWLFCGIANAIVNILVLSLSSKLPASLMFPMISAGGILITFLVSLFIYKEKLTRAQMASVFFGMAAIVLLNL